MNTPADSGPSSDREPAPRRGDAFEGDGQADADFDPAELEAKSVDGTASGQAPQVIDPYDPATYRAGQNFAASLGVKKVITECPVRKPDKSWWSRIHPDLDNYSMRAGVIEREGDEGPYLVLPHLWAGLSGEATFSPRALYLAQNRQGLLFLWPVRVPALEDETPGRWMVGPLKAVECAKSQWSRITWNNDTRQHDVKVSEAGWPEPVWPEISFRDCLKLGFGKRVIDAWEHAVLKELRGGK